MRLVMSFTILLGFGAVLRAERPPQPKERASDFVLGTVEKIDRKESAFGGDGVRTDFTATIKVKSVERGTTAKAGDTVTITWFAVTKRPSGLIVGAFGHDYGVAANETVKVWFIHSDKANTVIYNRDGIEMVKE
jgi:hypothetical protein